MANKGLVICNFVKCYVHTWRVVMINVKRLNFYSANAEEIQPPPFLHGDFSGTLSPKTMHKLKDLIFRPIPNLIPNFGDKTTF